MKTNSNQDCDLLTQAAAEQIANDLMATKAAIDAKAVSLHKSWVVVYARHIPSASIIHSTEEWLRRTIHVHRIKTENRIYAVLYMPAAKQANVLESIPYIDHDGDRPPTRSRIMPAATMPTQEEVMEWVPTAFSPPIRSNTFTDYAAHYSPMKKQAWLYNMIDRGYLIVANKDMEQPPTEREVTKWVVNFLNGRLNEELAELTKA